MELSKKRNLWIISGVLLLFIVKVEILSIAINPLLSILCFVKAYKLNQEVKANLVQPQGDHEA